jgi:hypothetical protein
MCSCRYGILEYLLALANHLLLRRDHESMHHGEHSSFSRQDENRLRRLDS